MISSQIRYTPPHSFLRTFNTFERTNKLVVTHGWQEQFLKKVCMSFLMVSQYILTLSTHIKVCSRDMWKYPIAMWAYLRYSDTSLDLMHNLRTPSSPSLYNLPTSMEYSLHSSIMESFKSIDSSILELSNCWKWKKVFSPL